jgi:hypothetical protein
MGIVININSDDAVDVVRTSAKGPKETIENHFISLVGMPKAKREKLLHYVHRDAEEFFQFDAFTGIEPGDDIIRPDDDGDCLCSGVTTELMTGNVSVRVLIVPGTTRKTTVRALKKIQGWIQRDADALNPAKLHGIDIDMPF